jgi:hypothetical protein
MGSYSGQIFWQCGTRGGDTRQFGALLREVAEVKR